MAASQGHKSTSIGPQEPGAVPKTVVKKVRLEPKAASELARAAKHQGRTESDLLREALEEVLRRDGVLRARRKNMEKLVALAEEDERAGRRSLRSDRIGGFR